MTARELTSFIRSTYPEAVVVEAHGELDVVSAPAFRAALAEAVSTGLPLVVVDLAHVQFVDSAGLAVVFGTQRTLPVTQRMVLAGVPDRMRRMLRLAAVDAVVEVRAPGEPQPWLEGGGGDAAAPGRAQRPGGTQRPGGAQRPGGTQKPGGTPGPGTT